MALQNISTDSTKLLTEKLALSRELSTLKPELEHLRSQTAAQQNLLAEKLSLERQLSTIQVELENEKRAVQRALAKVGKSSELDEEAKAENEELRKELAKEKRLREKAEKALDKAQSELETEKRNSKRAHAQLNKTNAQDTELDAQAEELREELSREKRERERAEKAIQKSQMEWEAQRALLDEKLNSFRTKLRSTKEKLKERDAELAAVQAAAAAHMTKPDEAMKAAKNPRKRGAGQMDPDATTLGTPGDGVPAKRAKRAVSAAPGEKSMFSITPFLNRTASVAADRPEEQDQEDANDQDDGEEALDAENTPSAAIKKVAKKDVAPKPKPLAPASTNKANTKPAPPRKKTAIPTLEKVAEEDAEENGDKQTKSDEQAKENEAPTDAAASKIDLVPKLKPKAVPRKSLMSFATFNEEPAPEKKKKRKLLGGGLGKTLFDEVEDAMPVKPIPGKGLFAARALGKGSLLGKGAAIKSGFTTTEDGFQFSPLKRDRKAVLAK